MKTRDYISQLPAELLIQVLSHLPIPDLKRVERVGKHLRETLQNYENVKAFLVKRQHAARARLSEKIERLTLRGFVDQKDCDFLDAFSAFVNRGGMSGEKSRYRYVMAAMIDLFKLNLNGLPPHVMQHTSEPELIRCMATFLHFLFNVHLTKHMPSSEMSCATCTRWSIDNFMQAIKHNCSKLEAFGFTQERILSWYQKLWNPAVRCDDDWADGIHKPGPPILDIVPEVEPPPHYLITHLMWHQGLGRSSRWGPEKLPVRVGLCSMASLAALFHVPSLPAKRNLRDTLAGIPMPINDSICPAYFFAYHVKSAWAYGLVRSAYFSHWDMFRLRPSVENGDIFRLTAILEELDIY